MSKYPLVKDGESFDLDVDKQSLRLACCSCGHVHIIYVERKEEGKCEVILNTDRRGTAQLRRHFFGDLQKVNNTKWGMGRTG